MADKLQIYKCHICGNLVEVLHSGAGELVCCGEAMEKLEAKSADEGKEKHVPVIEKTATGCKVKVGSVPHPMEEKHYIELIELIAGNKVYHHFLEPGQSPEAEFEISADNVSAREHCTVHGLWKGR